MDFLDDADLKEIILHMPGNVFWTDQHGRYKGCNLNVAKTLGLSSTADIIGKTIHELIADQAIANEVTRYDLAVIEGNQTVEMEQKAFDDQGNQAVYLTKKLPLHNTKGAVIGLLGISVDITKRKEAEKAALEAKSAAEMANRAKTEFLANMSHDIKTPLTGVIGMADIMVHDETLRSVDRERARIIRESGQQILALFNRCMELSTIEMQGWTAKDEVFSLQALADSIHTLLAPKAIAKNLSLNCQCDVVLSDLLEGPRESLYLILLNLVSNALKFTKKGKVTLKIQQQVTDAEQTIVEFHVQDSGIGIPKDKHQAIFERLYRLEPSYTNQVEGSGIGLYLVEQYVRRMNGEITVNSTLGQGSTFVVKIPLKVAGNQAVSTQSCSIEPTNLSVCDHKQASRSIPTHLAHKKTSSDETPRILLVEDTQIVQHITQQLLHSVGFRVDTANSGKEAIQLFAPEKYQVVCMDIGLPDMDGYAVAQALHDQENADRPTPIIALTGHGVVDIEKFCGQAGIQGILSKPLLRKQAEKIWQRYAEHQSITVPGLMLLETAANPCDENELLDITATLEGFDSPTTAYELIAKFVHDLETQFLPKIKVAIAQQDLDQIRFHLHQQMGALAYIKAPLLEKTLSDIQTASRAEQPMTQNTYHTIEKVVMQLAKHYQKRLSSEQEYKVG